MLKKIIVSLVLLIAIQNATLAAYSEIQQFCPSPPYPVGGGISKFLSNISGSNFLLTKIAEIATQKELKAQLDSKFDVELKAFGGKNLLDGKFKSLSLTSKQIASDELNATNFSANSLCEYNRIELQGNELYFLENFLMEFNSQITNDDLKRTVTSASYLSMFNKLNLNIAGFSVFKISDPTIAVKNNRLQMSIKTTGPNFLVSKSQTINIDTGIKVENEKIVFTDIKIAPAYNLSLEPILPIVNRMNPFVFKQKLDKNNTATIRVKNVKIINDVININGLVLVPKTIRAK